MLRCIMTALATTTGASLAPGGACSGERMMKPAQAIVQTGQSLRWAGEPRPDAVAGYAAHASERPHLTV